MSVESGKENGEREKKETESIEFVPLEVTVLENGVLVMSTKRGGLTSEVRVEVAFGTRDEVVKGAALVAVYASAAATVNASAQKLLRDVSRIGATLSVVAERERLVITLKGLPNTVPQLVQIISDMLAEPAFQRHEVEELIKSVKEQRDEGDHAKLDEVLHATAFPGQALGKTFFASDAELDALTVDDLFSTHALYFRPAAISVIATEADHSPLVRVVNKYFGATTARELLPRPATVYSGGFRFADGLSGEGQQGIVAFKGPGKDLSSAVNYSVLTSLLVNRSKKPVLYAYSDISLFGFRFSNRSESIGDSLKSSLKLLQQFNVSDAELAEAKAHTLVNLGYAQLTADNLKYPLAALSAAVEQLTTTQLIAFTESLVSSKSTLVVGGSGIELSAFLSVIETDGKKL